MALSSRRPAVLAEISRSWSIRPPTSLLPVQPCSPFKLSALISRVTMRPCTWLSHPGKPMKKVIRASSCLASARRSSRSLCWRSRPASPSRPGSQRPGRRISFGGRRPSPALPVSRRPGSTPGWTTVRLEQVCPRRASPARRLRCRLESTSRPAAFGRDPTEHPDQAALVAKGWTIDLTQPRGENGGGYRAGLPAADANPLAAVLHEFSLPPRPMAPKRMLHAAAAGGFPRSLHAAPASLSIGSGAVDAGRAGGGNYLFRRHPATLFRREGVTYADRRAARARGGKGASISARTHGRWRRPRCTGRMPSTRVARSRRR